MKPKKNTEVIGIELPKEDTTDTREKLIEYYTMQNEIVELRAKNVGFHRDIAVAEYQRLEALILMARLQAGPKEEAPVGTKAPVAEPERPIMKPV